jgi:hypothetical protein
MRPLLLYVLPVAAAVALAGCGGGGKSTSGGGSKPAGSGKTLKVDDALVFAITNCLIDANWNVQPTGTEIDGTSERGVLYTIKFYPTIDDAKARAGKKGIVVDNAVILFNVAGKQNAGGVNTPVAPTTEKDTITGCIEGSA